MKFVAVDWGSSSFRAWLLGNAGEIIASVETPQGVLSHEGTGFEQTLEQACGDWLKEESHLPVIMAGMVGSRNGWLETQYKTCPLKAIDLADQLQAVDNQRGWNLFIVPGVCSLGATLGVNNAADVMRGEEVQMFGALSNHQQDSSLVCLPGTHSKWAQSQGESLQSFSTFFTGEMFSLLKEKSSIGAVLSDNNPDPQAFVEGLQFSRQPGGFLNHIFSVRARPLTNTWSGGSLAAYLSGIAIGHEFVGAMTLFPEQRQLSILGKPELQSLYQLAAEEFGFESSTIDAADAFIKGINIIANKVINEHSE